MTTNQAIDGVLAPRELLERIADPYRREPRAVHLHNADVAELRALLDADKVNNRQMGLMQFIEAHPVPPPPRLRLGIQRYQGSDHRRHADLHAECGRMKRV